MHYAEIAANVVTNVIDIDNPEEISGLIEQNGWIEIPNGYGIGDSYNGTEWSKATQIIIIPSSVTPRQARLALLQSGLLGDVQAAIDSISDQSQKQAAQIDWEYSSAIERSYPLIQALITSLGLTESQIDELFIMASQL